jgi:hypothetical protein
MVVPMGLFQVKTGIYMLNKFNDLDRRPNTIKVKISRSIEGQFTG